MTEILRCFEVEPEAEATGSIIWLHGLGASGHDFQELPALLQLPGVRYVFPHAPQRPVTINDGLIMPAWYDVRTLSSAGGEEPRHVRESTENVRALVAREAERGVPAARIVLAGFSQGAATALFVGVRHPESLLGIMVLSGYEVLADTREDESTAANAATPMLFCHGTLDPLVPIERGRLAHDAVADPGRPLEWHEFPHAHTISIEEIDAIGYWLHARFASNPPD
jgi:phospholipase/carboxylesterase